MANIDAPGKQAQQRESDRRICRRISMAALGGMAVVQSIDEPRSAIPGRIVNVSGSGCCLLTSRWAANELLAGERCTVSLPVNKQGLHHPATLVSIERDHDSPDDVRLRIRFRKADPVTQQRLIRWLGELAIKSWSSQ